MRIVRILNNNAILAKSEDDRELVVLGSGIAFNKSAGDLVNHNKIEKSFYPNEDKSINRIVDTLASISPQFINLADQIIAEAQIIIGKKLSDDIYISLPDHLQFAVQRYNSGILIQNKLIMETMQTYPDEYQLGNNAVSLLNKTFNIQLPEDEAANIAMHFITAEDDNTLENTVETIKLVNQLVELIEHYLNNSLDQSSVQYYRLVTHLKFFSQRIQQKTNMENTVDRELYKVIISRYKDSYKIAQKLKKHILKNFAYRTNEDELMYLTIHIHRLSE